MYKSLLSYAGIPVLGIASQWLSWRLKVPSILVLLISGFIVGPVLNLIKPTELLGNTLFPIVSLSVAVILFEGGLSLKILDLKHSGKVVSSLITTGVFLSWGLISLAAVFILDLDYNVSLILGAILVVTGPTVIIPLLRHINLKRSISSILRWEGITIDPVGASLAVVVFDVVIAESAADLFGVVLVVVTSTLLAGFILGSVGAGILMLILNRRWLPEYLQEAVTLMLVFGIYAVSDVIQSESGLLSVTIMGIVLANQSLVTIKHIITFKENLSVLLLSSLFIILAANVQLADLKDLLHVETLAFVLVLIFFVRPFSVWVCTIGTKLPIRERIFLAFLAPRGIVAAAVSSLFSIKLIQAGMPQAKELVPITFLVIVVTVVFYGLIGMPLAKFLKLQQDHRSFLAVGAQRWVREMAKTLRRFNIDMVLVDTSKENILAAKDDDLKTIQGSILSGKVMDEIELGGFGRLLAVTPSDEVNVLATTEYMEVFEEASLFRLQPNDKSKSLFSNFQHGRYLFSKGATSTYLEARITAGAKFVSEKIARDYPMEKVYARYKNVIPFFLITPQKKLRIFNQSTPLNPAPGDRVICLVS